MSKTREEVFAEHQSIFAQDGLISIKGMKSEEIARVIKERTNPETWLADGDDPQFNLDLEDGELDYVNFVNCNFAKIKFAPIRLFRSLFLLCDLREASFAETLLETVIFDHCLTDDLIINPDTSSVIWVKGSDPARIVSGGRSWKAGDFDCFELEEED